MDGSSKRHETDAADVWTVSGPVPGGPHDGSVIPSFLGHIALGIWKGEDRGILKCQNRHTACRKLKEWYTSTSDEVRHMIDKTGLAHLPDTMFAHLDVPLISAFVERWQPDTSSFHLPFGEMTITLHDVWHILHIPVEGDLISGDPDRLQLQAACAKILGISTERLLDEGMKHLAQGGILIDSVINLCGWSRGRTTEIEAIAWIWLTLGCTLFVDKSGHRIRPACLWEVRDGLTDASSYSWGSATLAYLYRQLGVASRGDCHGLSGCMTLLQTWIYEYFPCFRPQRERMIIGVEIPRACSWSVSVTENADSRLQALRVRIDQLTADEVAWLPFGVDPAITVQRTAYIGWIRHRDILEPYMPSRVLRQLGYVQNIPPPILRPMKAVRSWRSLKYAVEMPDVVASDSWRTFPYSYILPFTCFERVTVIPGACVPQYMEWYARYSHPRLLNIDVAAPRSRPSRSNNDYWVTRMTSLSQKYIAGVSTIIAQHSEHCRVDGIVELEQLTAEHASELKQAMEEWRLAD
ncbi:protein MAIN-LIKE 1-like isoform X2 [Mercurialis annua]|uniref:protein MAIN-LIKE 1-like isoform X2 n=1 Tax=Mercurialis annua TaxID=3986 RepID=UPI00215FA8A2|nr:protein MAIN-LIKE 1-like isoform X2 [Mercurialis annua]